MCIFYRYRYILFALSLRSLNYRKFIFMRNFFCYLPSLLIYFVIFEFFGDIFFKIKFVCLVLSFFVNCNLLMYFSLGKIFYVLLYCRFFLWLMPFLFICDYFIWVFVLFTDKFSCTAWTRCFRSPHFIFFSAIYFHWCSVVLYYNFICL